jgi:hypothetical protein
MGRRISRRTFLNGALISAAGLGAFLYGDEATGMISGALDARQAWRTASLSNDQFLAAKAAAFERVVLGFSFAPEQWSEAAEAAGEPLRALDFCTRELGLNEARLGIRWDRVAQADGSVDLRPYRPYLDYCFSHGLNLCLNVGPIRTFRWPEDRVPPFVLSSLARVPAHGETIEWGSPLAAAAMSYLDVLVDQLLAEYGSQIAHLASIQPENESFQSFDRNAWSVSSGYMTNLIYELNQRLPDVPVLVTSAGRPALAEITDIFEDLLGKGERFQGRLVSGFDYYYATPRHDEIPLHRYIDPIALAFHFPSAKTCAANIADSRAAGFRIEVSEGQAEPYAQVTAPGNSVQDFRFMLLRCAENALDPEQMSILRIWGVEELAKKALANQTTEQHEEIFDLIRRM